MGCSSSKPPPQPPPAVAYATGLTAQAQKLFQQKNWPGATHAWHSAADQYRLLNDLPNLATSLHQLGLAQQGGKDFQAAHASLERAAELNDQLDRRNEWWADQIALLQIEALSDEAGPLAARIERLTPLADQNGDPMVSGLFLTELGLHQQSRGKLTEAGASFDRAQAAFEGIGYRYGVAAAQANRARLAETKGDHAGAFELWSRALETFEELAEPTAITRALAGQGRTLLALGEDLPQARELLRRAAENYRVLHLLEEQQAVLELLK